MSAAKVPASTRLTEIARSEYTFGSTPNGEPYALPLYGPRVVRMLRGGGSSLRAELASAYLDAHGAPPSQQALADAMTALEGLALRSGPRELHMRTALHDGALWLDIGDQSGEVIQVSAFGWGIESEAPVLHRRSALTAPMVRPAGRGDLSLLWRVLNVAPADRDVLLAWLVASWLPDAPRPVLLLTGEQGTGKSTASRLLVSLVDPSTVPLRKPPKDADAWTTAALGSNVVALDNLSSLPAWLSDALCRAATGDGDVKRRLYSDADLHVFAFRRAVIVNGIELGTIADDLADRLVTVELQRIGEAQRRPDADLQAEFTKAAPAILAGLLDLAVDVLTVLPDIELDRAPRMADFARIAAAVSDQALRRYADGARDLATEAVTGDPVLVAITERIGAAAWTGTAADLLDLLEPGHGDRKHPRGWPTSARALAGILRRRAPSLRRLGWTVETTDERTKRGQVWTISPPSGPVDSGDESGDETVTRLSSSPVRHRVRHPNTPQVTCEDIETAGNGDEVTTVPSNLLLSTEKKIRRREGPENSSPRHHPDPEAVCGTEGCTRALGRSELSSGVCWHCRNIAARTGVSR